MTHRSLFVLAAFVLLAGVSAGCSSPFKSETGTPARGDEIAALQVKATAGDAEAQFSLGMAYEFGRGVPQDYPEAVSWYRKAANQSHAGAQYCLGYAYFQGQGVPQDDVQAAAWWRKAADQGFVRAQSNLAVMYETGEGVPEDDVQAVSWYRKAADQGDAPAQFQLGRAYDHGTGVPRDVTEAYKWYDLAASRAFVGYHKLYTETRDTLAKGMTPQQLADARQRASAWIADFEKRDK